MKLSEHFFSSKGGLVNWFERSFTWNETLQTTEKAWQGVFRAVHPHTPFLGDADDFTYGDD